MDHDEVLAKLRKDVRSLLISSKVGLEPDQLRRDYMAMLGHPVPLKALGFRHIMDMVEEMPDVASVHFRPDGSTFLKAVGDDSTRNIEELVAHQRMSKTTKASRRGGGSYFSSRYRHPPPAVLLPRRGRAPLAVPVQLRAQLSIMLSQGPLRLSDLEAGFLRCFGHPLRVHNYGFYSTGEMLEALADLVLVQQGRLGSVLTLKDHVLPKPPLRLASSPRTGPVKPDSRTQTPTNVSVPTKQSPVDRPPPEAPEPTSDPQEPSTGNENQEAKPEPFFQKRVRELEEELRHRILENGVAGTISPELKEKLQQVVGQAGGRGLSVHDLPDEYKKLFGEELPLQRSGFVSVTELVGAMSDAFRLKAEPSGAGQHWMVTGVPDNAPTGSEATEWADDAQTSYYTRCAESRWEGKLEGDDEDDDDDGPAADEHEETKTSNNVKTHELVYPAIQVHRGAVPLDALQSQRLEPPTRHAARQLVEVLVEHVESPGHFYVSFSGSEESGALQDMMFDMRRCYTCPQVKQRYRLPERFVRPGQACCVSPMGMWFYRVVIHRVISAAEVEVYYVDYGDVMVVQRASLAFLKSCYSVLPAQAVPASLAGIRPTAGGWTAEAGACFQKMCADCPLVGALDRYTGDVLQLYICDTRTKQDLYVHAALLSQGHAAACGPAASAALCVLNGPVSLYLGDGRVELPEVEEEEEDIPELSLQAEDDEEMPDLEEIEYSGGPYDQIFSYRGGEWPLAHQSPPPSPSCWTPLAPPDLIQTTAPAHRGAHLETLTPPPPPTPSVTSGSRDPPKEEQHEVAAPLLDTPPSILRTLSLLTPALGQIHNYTRGIPISTGFWQNSGMRFPLFGSR
ncbi:tudor domain-containing protein 5 isoform X2 [Pseudoliparis swirei]|uniref:tudor domain-containing protein 5 isoform X2 n=1 Tax=Pseudoliparis swirei TaxID=2059687 RepID=UPI0024BE8351|nr:tudor domain-containing protein 5 isoform X2 [Pseudoliparis swirei]